LRPPRRGVGKKFSRVLNRAAIVGASINRSCNSMPARPQTWSRPTWAFSKSLNGIPRNGKAPPGRKWTAIAGSSAAISDTYETVCDPVRNAGGTLSLVRPSAA